MIWLGSLLALLLVFTLFSIFVSTLRTGIPPRPSHLAARSFLIKQAEQLLGSSSGQVLIDLGSGWGHLVVPLARRFPQHQIIGYEVSWVPWLVTQLLKKLLGLNNLQVYRKDFFQEDLSQADLVFCYLLRPSMLKLAERFSSLDSHPRLVLSHFFTLPGYSPARIWQLPDWYQSPCYLYRLDANAQDA